MAQDRKKLEEERYDYLCEVDNLTQIQNQLISAKNQIKALKDQIITLTLSQSGRQQLYIEERINPV